jgi:two-component system sensor histidine kinase HydH
MFSAQSSESNPRIPVTVAVVFATLLLAFALSLLATLQVRDEYRLLGWWLARARPVQKAEIAALRQDIGTRIIARSAATAVLLLCTLATLWLQQRQLAVRKALDRVKLFARDVLSSLNQGVITTDRRSVVTSINAAAVSLLGVDPDCVGKPVASISSAEVPLEALSRQVTGHRGPTGDRELALDRGGRTIRLVVSALELKDTLGATIGCVINLRDVTERMLMKEQVWRMQQFASLSTLASGLHHEIKNPITALSIHVQLLEERLLGTDAAPAVAEPIGVLKAEVRRLNSTLESFRNFASLERLRLEPVDVEGLLEDTARLISPQAARQGVRLELRRAGEPLPRVPLDPEKVRQAVLNLVLNALEAMPGGGTLGLAAARADGSVRVAVRDTGPGIPPEVQEHLFHPYFSTKDRGTGIGLALAEKLVRQHDGRLDYRTGPTGTSFTITLPLGGPGRSDTRT